MKKAPLLFLILIYQFSFAQFRNNIWCFGDSAGIDFINPNNPVTFNTSLDTRGSAVSIADSLGNLLFYAGTISGTNDYSTHVYNKQHVLMENGSGIAGEDWYKELVIIPVPDNLNLYYLFSSRVVSGGFYYSIIDLSYNGGLGKVVQKNIQLQTFFPADGLAAIKHGNGRDWWILLREWDPNATNYYDSFYSYLINPDSISGPFVQHIGELSDASFYRIEPSLSGNKIAVTEPVGIIEVFDFDRCSGLLSNTLHIQSDGSNFPPYPGYWSCELSPDESKLYISADYTGVNLDSSYLFQFDLNAANILASKDTLASFIRPQVAGNVELAPDSKIYFTVCYEITYPYPDSVRNTTNENLGVINSPDSLGSACDYQPFSFNLGGKRTYYGLPNVINYELPALGGSLCDTLATKVYNNPLQEDKAKLNVFYHSGWQIAFINAQGLSGRKYTLQIADISGKEVFSENGFLNSQYYTKDFHCEKLGRGIYLVLFETEKERLLKKMVIE